MVKQLEPTWVMTGGGEAAVSLRPSAVDILHGVVVGRLGCVEHTGCRPLNSWWWPGISPGGSRGCSESRPMVDDDGVVNRYSSRTPNKILEGCG